MTELGLRHESSRWANLLPPVGNAYWSKFYAGDFNGDGRDDLAAFNSTAGEWTIAISDGNRFVLNHLQLGTPDDHWQITSVGDFDGDGSDELIGRTHLSGSWQVLHFSEQAGASLENWGHSFGGYTDWTIFVGDVDQDGRDDLVARRPFVPGNWYAVLSEPTEGATGHFSGSIGLSKSLDPYFVGGNFTVADFDGQFHPEFARDATSVSTRGPFQEALDLFSPIYNEIEVEFYPGLMKGPQATRETRAGNPLGSGGVAFGRLTSGRVRSGNRDRKNHCFYRGLDGVDGNARSKCSDFPHFQYVRSERRIFFHQLRNLRFISAYVGAGPSPYVDRLRLAES